MNKQAFLSELRKGLSGLPRADLEEQLAFYGEMLDDRIEDGVSEEEAVAEMGSIEALTAQIIADMPLKKLVKARITPQKKPKAWIIVLLAFSVPIGLPLLIAALAVVFSLYVSLWTVLIALWAVFASLAAGGAALAVGGAVLAVRGNALSGIAAIGMGCVAAGLSVFLFFGCKAATKGVLRLSQSGMRRIKNRLIRKEDASCEE